MSETSDAANRIAREVPIGGLGQRTLAKEIDKSIAAALSTSNTLIEEQAARIAALEAEIGLAKNDLRSFMTSFVREHFFDNDGWRPLPDLLGMLSQMDNASTVARTYRDRADDSQARLSEAVKVLEPLIEQAAHVCIGASTPMDIRDAAKKLHSPIVAAKAFLATIGEENER